MKLETLAVPQQIPMNVAAEAVDIHAATMPASTIDVAELARRLEQAREEERVILARDLHDGVGGTLAALRMIISQLRKHAGNAPIKTELDEMSGLTDRASGAIQDVIRALRPGILDQGLVAAVEWEARDFQRRTGIVCNYRTNRPKIDIPKAQGVALYRICQEALTNVAKHAGASIVEVVVHRDAGGVSLEITDNGAGFDIDAAVSADSFGLIGMRERLRAYGGWIEVNAKTGAGTTVMAGLPLRRAQDSRQ